MKYISEERLRELLAQYKAVAELNCNPIHFDGMLDMLEMVIDECKELNPWQPIESAPKDRKIMIFSDEYGWEFGRYNEKSARWSCHTRKPKAWIEIPEPPK